VNVCSTGVDSSVIDEDIGVAKLIADPSKQVGHRVFVCDISHCNEGFDLGVNIVDASFYSVQSFGVGSHKKETSDAGACKCRADALHQVSAAKVFVNTGRQNLGTNSATCSRNNDHLSR